MSDKYQLNIKVEIQHLDERGCSWGGERLSVNEEMTLDLHNFLAVAEVLGRFHDLAKAVKAERS